MAANAERFDQLTIADMFLVARARGVDVPHGAKRAEIVALLRNGGVLRSVRSSRPSLPSRTERAGWWTSVSVDELRNLARDHGVDIPAGIRRRELIDLIIEHGVPRPARPDLVVGAGPANGC